MEINYTRDAFDSLSALLLFIEKENTKGAGIRWLNKFESFLMETLPSHEVMPFCNNKTFHQLKLKGNKHRTSKFFRSTYSAFSFALYKTQYTHDLIQFPF